MEEIRELSSAIQENAAKTEEAILGYCLDGDRDLQKLFDSERYSLIGGGKRVRPFLTNEFCRLFGGSIEASMPLAAAVEFIHTYSLIHDDLPCMDDDDYRRGKPSNHKMFDYATALLAGDALLTKAFYLIATADTLSAEQKAESVKILSSFAGECGMIGGQIIDLDGEKKTLDLDTLIRLHTLKCGALIECAARLGCAAAGFFTGSHEAEAAAEYARKVGVAFQVIDDILDEIEDATVKQGEDKHKDTHQKTTFLTYYNEEEARKYAAELTAEAISAISEYKGSALLTDFAAYLLDRNH